MMQLKVVEHWKNYLGLNLHDGTIGLQDKILGNTQM